MAVLTKQADQEALLSNTLVRMERDTFLLQNLGTSANQQPLPLGSREVFLTF